VIVLDLSSNDLGTIDIPGFLAAGVEGVVLGVYSANPPHDMAAVAQQCMDAGLPVIGFYGLVYFGDAAAEERDTRWAIELAQQFGVQNVWMDVETDAVDEGWRQAPRPSPAQRVSALLRVETLITDAGLTPGVYTYRGFWESQMGNAAGFRSLPLWFASYGADEGNAAPITTVDFGGWTDLAAHQFTSNWGLVHGCGRIHRDASYWYQEAGMTPEQIKQLNDATLSIAALKLAAFSGAEEATLDDATRFANADYRIQQRVHGAPDGITADSLGSLIQSVTSVAAQHHHDLTGTTGPVIGDGK